MFGHKAGVPLSAPSSLSADLQQLLRSLHAAARDPVAGLAALEAAETAAKAAAEQTQRQQQQKQARMQPGCNRAVGDPVVGRAGKAAVMLRLPAQGLQAGAREGARQRAGVAQ